MTNLPELPPVIGAYVEALNTGNFPKLMRLFTDDALIFGVLGSAPVSKAEAIWRELHEGLAMHLEPEAVAVDGLRVVVRYVESGRFQGAFRGLAGQAPTGRSYKVIAMEWFEIKGDKIAKRWGTRDFGSIKDQVLH
jgi:hypothetical protein